MSPCTNLIISIENMTTKGNMILELEKVLKETKSVRIYKRYPAVLKHLKMFSKREIA